MRHPIILPMERYLKTTILFFYIFVQTLVLNAAQFEPYPAYIDSLEDGQYITVFDKPGFNWSTCTIVLEKKTNKEICKEAVGWPGRDAKIKVISPPIKKFVFDPYTDEEVEDQFVKIEFEYDRMGEDEKMHHQKGVGYVDFAYLSKSVRNPFFGAQSKTQKTEPCKKSDAKTSGSSEQQALRDIIKPIQEATEDYTIAEKAKEVSTLVGKCALKPSTSTPDYKGKKNIYDHYVLPDLKKTKTPSYMSNDQLIEIDALSRTLYGEMARCYKHGLQYPMTVAKIIQNRKVKNRKGFVQPPHEPGKPMTAKVATTPSQFSMWHKVVAGKKNNPLRHGLCPPQKPGGPYWHSQKAPKMENDIWQNTVRIATEAVLDPKTFNKRTQNVKQTHYSSGMSENPNSWMKKMKQVYPSVEGRVINRNSCLEIWQEKS